ncbi:MAG: cbb3-type cytochrome c oxidase subunit II [Candidatus Eremiobacteraeota bacterium]|nr:cbb3-type cytochrome c oxidase subunit II [Candidatus Eremiobacteraeota bacterium]
MNNVWTIVIASAVVYGVLAIAMGVIPGIVLSRTPPTSGLRPPTSQERDGRDVYVSEGCEYCHTQNVRPLKQDLVFGRPSVAGDYAFSTPELLGDHRNGPDLTNIGNRQPSDTWQYIHLWDPRAVVNESIMPRYTWLFTVKTKADPQDLVIPVPPDFGPKNEVVIATQRAKDLVAYLHSLQQVPLSKATRKP